MDVRMAGHCDDADVDDDYNRADDRPCVDDVANVYIDIDRREGVRRELPRSVAMSLTMSLGTCSMSFFFRGLSDVHILSRTP